MDERQLVCYPRSGTCSLRNSVGCVKATFSPLINQIKSNHSKIKGISVLLKEHEAYSQASYH